MTQEEKELLFIDLCNRIHYKTICTSKRFNKSILVGMDDDGATFSHVDYLGQTVYELLDIIEFDVKPYLRPLSSMTEEEYESVSWKGCSHTYNYSSKSGFQFVEIKTFTLNILNWLNAHHFDYRGLIEKKLALDCTGLHIYD